MCPAPRSEPEKDVAIVGLACRFPDAPDVETFWEQIRRGAVSRPSFSDTELIAAGVEPELVRDPNYVKSRPCLEDCEHFDATFFGISRREAELMDPQHRLLLECSWEALETAGYDPDRARERIAVFAGAGADSYLLRNLLPNRDLLQEMGYSQVCVGNDRDYLATRISHKLGLSGPSLSVNTACSTSLVAVHLACRSLLGHECDMALAGGVSIQVPTRQGYYVEQSGILSPDGDCRPFDAGARGTLFGDGAGVVALKRLRDALNDGDRVWAVVKGTAVNNDGARKVGYSAPSVIGQAEVVAECQELARAHPETITYVEAHGTGTALGDPTEIAALTKAFRRKTQRCEYCAVGSVKANVGHLNTAAGIAGLIKTTLALQHAVLPPSACFERPNPRIDFAATPFYVASSARRWERLDGRRRAGVSAFGMGGTNAHVVLEEAPEPERPGPSRRLSLLVLSAKTEGSLERACARLAGRLEGDDPGQLADVAYTLQVGRRHHGHRRALLCETAQDALQGLSGARRNGVWSGVRAEGSSARPVAFLFPGQGSQYVGMGAGLYAGEAVFREELERCAEILRPHLERDFLEVLYPPAGGEEPVQEELKRTVTAQPALFAVEYALARTWMDFGIRPAAMLGHSLGEYVAACLSGVLSLEDALAVVAARGRLMQAQPEGAMLAVALPEAELAGWSGAEVDVAATNGPALSVASGSRAAVSELERELTSHEVEWRRLETSHAFHSRAMSAVAAPFREVLSGVKLEAPRIPYLSNLTGTWVTESQACDPEYWTSHMVSGVRFGAGLSTLFADGEWALLEAGPGRTLSTLVLRHPERNAAAHSVAGSLRAARGSEPDDELVLGTLASLWANGVSVDWHGFSARERRVRVPLPTYPFERERYWIDPPELPATPSIATPRSPAARRGDVAEWTYVPSWKRTAPPVASADRGPQRWLVFATPSGFGADLLAALRRRGEDLTTVVPGGSFRRDGDVSFAVDPKDPSSYEALFAALEDRRRLPTRVLHLWNLSADPSLSSPSFDSGFYSLLFLCQAVGSRRFPAPLRIDVVSSGVQSVTGNEELHPEKATLLGPVEVAPLESPNVRCRTIDVEVPTQEPERARLVERLLAELEADAEPTVAYRGQHRWVRTFEPALFPRPAPEKSPLRRNGVYLITGGRGGVGAAIAELLVRTCDARLILTGRSPVPSHDERLAHRGEDVMIAQADVTDRERMSELVRAAEARFGAVHGVIHAAGVAGGGMVQGRRRGEVAKVFAPKVEGARVLSSIFETRSPDFIVFCSSIDASLGQVGQVDYCAANAFLDLLAHALYQRGHPVTSIGWDVWSEAGMAVDSALPAQLEARRAERLELGMLDDEGFEVLQRVLSASVPGALVSTLDLAERIESRRREQESFGMAGDRQALSTTPEEEREELADDDLRTALAGIWRDLLGVETIRPQDNFFEIGGHSLLGTQMLSRVRDTVGVAIPLGLLFQHPTLDELAQLVARSDNAVHEPESVRDEDREEIEF